MFGILKRWFVTHEEVKGLYGQLETMALSYQELVREQQSMREQLGLDVAQIGVHRPKGYILNGGRPAADIHYQRTDNLKARKLPAKPVVVDEPDEPKLKPPQFPWVESVVTMEHTIRNKMSQLCGSSENFIRLCRKKDCHVLVSKTTRVLLDQSGKTDKLREYPHGYIEMRNKRKRTSAGNPMRKYYTFESPQGYENAKKALESMNCPYSTGKAQ